VLSQHPQRGGPTVVVRVEHRQRQFVHPLPTVSASSAKLVTKGNRRRSHHARAGSTITVPGHKLGGPSPFRCAGRLRLTVAETPMPAKVNRRGRAAQQLLRQGRTCCGAFSWRQQTVPQRWPRIVLSKDTRWLPRSLAQPSPRSTVWALPKVRVAQHLLALRTRQEPSSFHGVVCQVVPVCASLCHVVSRFTTHPPVKRNS
jgi:hypothetical protein